MPRERGSFPVAEPLLRDLLASAGFELTDDPDRIEVVVVAWDRTFDYAKLPDGLPGGPARRPDRRDEPRPVLPDARRRPAGLCGDARGDRGVHRRPSRGRRRQALGAHGGDGPRALHLSPDDTILIGDRLLTDVRMAREAGMHAALVLSGATGRGDLPIEGDDVDQPDAPDFVLDDVTQLIPIDVR